MKIDKKIRAEAEKLVDKFIKAHAEKDDAGKYTGNNPILTVSTRNLNAFIKSDEYYQVGKIPIPTTMRRSSEKRMFHQKLRAHAKHYFKSKMDFKEYNEEFEHDPNIMIENYKEYVKIKEEEEWS